jgi:hypothetical protein
MSDKEFMNNRYAALMDLWIHHNSILFQWPSVVISAAVIVISIVVSGSSSRMMDITRWGSDVVLKFSAGVPLLITGIAIIVMLYQMGRSRRIVLTLDEELDSIESELGQVRTKFSRINHPKGLSGPRLIRIYMAVCLAAPMMFLGLSFIFGLIVGVILSVMFVVGWIVLDFHHLLQGRAVPRPSETQH